MKLQPSAFIPVRLDEIKPTGWLRQQLRLQAEGLHGHLDEFWPDIGDSQWFGGNSESWERAPYWLDGLIPLAYLLDDMQLTTKVHRYMDYILVHQHEDGWFGPRIMVPAAGRAQSSRYDLWAQILFSKVLVQYAEISQDSRTESALTRNLQCIERHIDRVPLFNWGQFRWFESLIAIFWLYERSGESWLLDLAQKLKAQGFDWAGYFTAHTGWPSKSPTPKGRWGFMSHVVNNAMAVKSQALVWRLTGKTQDREILYTMLDKLHRFHGMVNGLFTGDECLAGLSPTQGTELCAVVEYAYSLEVALAIFGDAAFGDHVERIIYNALPATFSPDMWAHQYDQQVNQIECSVLESRSWTTNGPESNIFGVEPNYGCCTANLGQGWPKFAAHLWMRTLDDGLAAVLYAPNHLHTEVKGVPVQVDVATEYPFDSRLVLSISTAAPIEFPLYLRIPEWTTNPSLTDTDGTQLFPEPGTFFSINRQWLEKAKLTLDLPTKPELLHRKHAVSLVREPLVFALKLEEDWRQIHTSVPGRERPHADWEVYPISSWNYALHLSEDDPQKSFEFHKQPLSDTPFSPEGAPITVKCNGQQVPGWKAINGDAADVPGIRHDLATPIEELTLIPYGCTNLRVTEFPFIKKD
jgi:hypothetical protein